jgi:hypothetical protein
MEHLVLSRLAGSCQDQGEGQLIGFLSGLPGRKALFASMPHVHVGVQHRALM